ncbi:MAG: hypothetical protein FH758_03525 [Firmicutes bacterium]|nr:hypothetical protein [Bacillota bacterium]
MPILNESPDNINTKMLFYLLKEYDTYIQSAVKKQCHKNGWTPLSIDEFYDTEFKMYNVDMMLLENEKKPKQQRGSWSTLSKNQLRPKRKSWWSRWLP